MFPFSSFIYCNKNYRHLTLSIGYRSITNVDDDCSTRTPSDYMMKSVKNGFVFPSNYWYISHCFDYIYTFMPILLIRIKSKSDSGHLDNVIKKCKNNIAVSV